MAGKHINTERPKPGGSPNARTVIVVGLAVGLFQPELLPGMIIGVVAVLGPRLVPGLDDILRPVATEAVRSALRVALKGIARPLIEATTRAVPGRVSLIRKRRRTISSRGRSQ